MLLAIDAGNTNTVFAVMDNDDQIIRQWRSSSDRGTKTADEYAVWLTQLMALEGVNPADITDCIIATVVPQGLFNLRGLCRKYFNCEPLVVSNQIELGIEVRIDRPGDVGADRLVNAVAAFNHYKQPLIIIDFGTATTFDVVAEDGAYIGGVICPGVNLSQQALQAAAAKLPTVAVEAPSKVIGTETIGAMQSGIFYGYVGLIEGVTKRIVQEYGKPMKVIATGGLAPLFNTGTDVIEAVERDLTVQGLALINRLNKNQ